MSFAFFLKEDTALLSIDSIIGFTGRSFASSTLSEFLCTSEGICYEYFFLRYFFLPHFHGGSEAAADASGCFRKTPLKIEMESEDLNKLSFRHLFPNHRMNKAKYFYGDNSLPTNLSKLIFAVKVDSLMHSPTSFCDNIYSTLFR